MITGRQQDNKVRQWVLDAEERCREYIWETPLEYSLHLSNLTSAEVYLKLDLMQKNGFIQISWGSQQNYVLN